MPTLSSNLYSAPLNINTTTILRAAAFKSGCTSSNVDTQTYIFLTDVIRQSAADVTASFGSWATWGHDKDGDGLTGYDLDDESDWEMDPDIVNNPNWSSTIIDDLKAIPTMSVVMDWDDLFSGTPQPGTPTATATVAPAPQGIYIHGRGDERPSSLEYFNPANPADQFQIDGAIEMQGHSSHAALEFGQAVVPGEIQVAVRTDRAELSALRRTPRRRQRDDGVRHAHSRRRCSTTGGLTANFQQFAVARFVTDQVVSDLQNSGGRPGAARQVRASVPQRLVLGPLQRSRAARRLVRGGILRRQQGRLRRHQARQRRSGRTSSLGSKAA